MASGGFSLATVGEFVGRELGVSDWLAVDQARIDAFADCTGDHNWIHVDVERAAREGPFGTTVAHGYLTLSLLPQLSDSIGMLPPDASQMLNYGVERARLQGLDQHVGFFLAPRHREPRELGPKRGCDAGQQIRCDRRDYTDADGA